MKNLARASGVCLGGEVREPRLFPNIRHGESLFQRQRWSIIPPVIQTHHSSPWLCRVLAAAPVPTRLGLDLETVKRLALLRRDLWCGLLPIEHRSPRA
jgi:hypothetical protein